MVKLKMICPFHNEETPSLVIDYDKQEAHCFGCDKTYTFKQLDDRLMEVLIDDIKETEKGVSESSHRL